MVRDKKGRFIKGESGNKKGRPKGDVIALIDSIVSDEDWTDIIKKGRELAKHGNLKWAEFLFDRRFGKPMQRSEISGKDGGPITIEWSEVVGDTD